MLREMNHFKVDFCMSGVSLLTPLELEFFLIV